MLSRIVDVAGRLTRTEVVVLVLVSPLFLLPLVFGHRWALVGTILVAAFWLLRRLARGHFTVATPLDGAILLVLVMALVGLTISVHRSLSLPRFWAILYGIALYYGLTNALRTRPTLRLAGDLMLLGSLGLALLAVIRTGWQWGRMIRLPLYDLLPTLPWEWLDGNLSNPRSMGMALAILLPVPLAHVLWGTSRRRRLLSGLVTLSMVVLLGFTQSLQGMLGLAAGLLVLLMWRTRWSLVLVPLGLIAAVLILLFLGPQQVALTLLSVDDPIGIGVVLRLDMWGRALAMIRDMPYTGIGLETFPLIQSGFYPGLIIGPEVHAHNVFIQVALDLGLPGLFAILWMLISFFALACRAFRRLAHPDLRALLAGSVAGVAAYLGAGLIDAPWWTKPAVLLWALLGTGVAVARLAEEPSGAGEPLPPIRRRWAFLPLAGLVLMLTVSLVLAPGIGRLNLGLVQAHKLLTQLGTEGTMDMANANPARDLLAEAVERYPDRTEIRRTLGGLRAAMGSYQRATEAVEAVVALDAQDPLGRYAPWVLWERKLQNAPDAEPWEDLEWVYSHWLTRFPERAEVYVQTALLWEVHKGDVARARSVLEAGLARDAQPSGWLADSLTQLE